MADNNSILEKLDGLVARFEEVSTLITDPAVIADQKRKTDQRIQGAGRLDESP
mgnify:CR=1 FL=1